MNKKISHLRYEYSHQSLTEDEAAAHPVDQFDRWWSEVMQAELFEANAMVLATAGTDGFPSARVVLLKEYNRDGFMFFTNYESYKGQQLEKNPRACLVFFWKEVERQVRITGIVSKLSDAENDDYFYSRPKASQAGAVASPQSRVIESREWLHERYEEILKAAEATPIQRPAHWGGYRVKPVIVEFWQGRPGRLHDRLQYTLLPEGHWNRERLSP